MERRKKGTMNVRATRKIIEERNKEEERQRRKEEKRCRKEEEERLRQEQLQREAEEARIRKREKKRENKEQRRREGKPVTPSEKRKAKELEEKRKKLVQINQVGNVAETKIPQVETGADNTKKDDHVEASTLVSSEEGNFLRSPICCIMGHVDAGKTKLLDCIHGTNVQKGETGGIAQQIGATYVPAENIQERIKELEAADDKHIKLPGLLLIDTPEHEPFANLRSRGSSLCDIVVFVVDIMDGLKPQTIESLNFLKWRSVEFIVALNKVNTLRLEVLEGVNKTFALFFPLQK